MRSNYPAEKKAAAKEKNAARSGGRRNIWGYIGIFIVGMIVAGTISTLIFSLALRNIDNNYASLSSNTSGTQALNSVLLPTNPSDTSQNSIDIRTVPILAVSSDNNAGVVGNLTVRLIPGSSDVLLDTSPFTETDLQYSAKTAVTVARLLSNDHTTDKDFVLSYDVPGDVTVIGGGSAGAATTIATLAALENKTIAPHVAITGTVNSDGTIGDVAGIPEKAKAAADAGYKILLIPRGQSTIVTYKRQVQQEPVSTGMTVYYTKYVPTEENIVDEAKAWGLEVKEVGTIEEAAKYLLQ